MLSPTPASHDSTDNTDWRGGTGADRMSVSPQNARNPALTVVELEGSDFGQWLGPGAVNGARAPLSPLSSM